MDSRKVFRALQLIGSLVGVVVIACAGYFGYGLYEEYKATKPTPESSQASSPAPDTPAHSTAAKPEIDWDHIMTQTKDTPDTKQDANDAKSSTEPESPASPNTPATPTKPTPATKSAASAPESKKPAIKTLAPAKAKKQLPKLAIIMDDIAYRSQLNDLQKLRLTITPSFFPVSPDSPETDELAAGVAFYMVHLPLEAQTPLQTRQKWLLETSSKDEIRDHIQAIKQDFPRLMFVNNHTGSRFTANERAMGSLLEVLQEFGLEFVDSRTSADTAVPKLYKLAKKPLLQRDVFLDNTPSVGYTTRQLKLAIATAKKKGYAIAIAHPHQSTFQALANAKQTILKEVELVYLKDLPLAKSLIAQNLAQAKATLAGADSLPAKLPPADAIHDGAEALAGGEQDPSGQNPTDTAATIPHNDYLDPERESTSESSDPESISPESARLVGEDSKEIDAHAATQAQDSPESSEIESKDAKNAHAKDSTNVSANAQAPKAPEPAPKPSQIDRSVFKEAKRQTKAQSTQGTKVKPKAAAKASTKSRKTQKGIASFESIKDCEQSEVEAFISGCPSNKIKPPQGFIDMEWSSQKPQSTDAQSVKSSDDDADSTPESNKPKDFLDASGF